VRTIVAVVICGLLAVPARASTTPDTGRLLRSAAQLSGLTARRPVPSTVLSRSRYEALLVRARARDYPRALQRVDARLYSRLGLMTKSLRPQVGPGAQESHAWYDPSARRLLLRRTPVPRRAGVIHELVRALVDQNFGLRRLVGLRVRDRDRALAAKAIVDGTAALASGRRATAPAGTPLDRFLQLEESAGLGPGRALAFELRYLGGRAALATALRTFPQTTEQLLHVDKFLERELPLRVRVPSRIGDFTLSASEPLGELDVRALLRAFDVANASGVAAGWGGGRVALYLSRDGDSVAAVVLRWDTANDAAEWRNAFPRYVAAAFPGATAQGDCPPLDRCWSGTADVAVGALGETSVFASGPGARDVAAALLIRG
jgi:hypothetical protein